MLELHPTSMANGGEAIARRDGKAHFIAGAMPGEVVEAQVVEDRGSWARAALVEVVEASPARREAPCPHASVCGGCQWQHATIDEQRLWKHDIVVGQLEHIGRLVDPAVHPTVEAGPELGYRNRMDFHVVDGRPGLMRARSNDVVPLDSCPLLHPSMHELFASLGEAFSAILPAGAPAALRVVTSCTLGFWLFATAILILGTLLTGALTGWLWWPIVGVGVLLAAYPGLKAIEGWKLPERFDGRSLVWVLLAIAGEEM